MTPAFPKCSMTMTCVAAMLGYGCASTPAEPRYPSTRPATVVATIRERSAALQSLTAHGALTLSDPKRGAVRLETAFVLAPPDRARIRAWKFNQAVFDLTLTPAGVWLYSPRAEANEGLGGSGGVATSLRQWLGYLAAGVDDVPQAEWTIDDDRLVIHRGQADGSTLSTMIDRATRTVRSYTLTGPDGVERFRLALDRYQLLGSKAANEPTLWPTLIKATSPGRGTIIIETDSLEPNVAAPAAFTPPARAKRLP